MNKDTVEEFWGWGDIVECFSKATHNSQAQFRKRIGEFLSVDPSTLATTPSGRSALTWLLQSIGNRSDKEVLICAFNCEAVLNSIIKSSLKPAFYDLSSHFGKTETNDLEALITPNTAAVVISHFFGVPTDFRALIEKCKYTGTIIIEDCAHTLGGLIHGEPAGTIGDAAIFSFNYDKPISLGWGGLLLINNRFLLDRLTTQSFLIPSKEEEKDLLKLFLTTMEDRRNNIAHDQKLQTKFLRVIGRHKRHIFNLPNLDIGPLRAELGMHQLERYNDISILRNTNAHFIAKNCTSLPTWFVGDTVSPVWLKQKILTKSPRNCKSVKRLLHREGIRVGNFNWGTILPRDVGAFKNSNYAASESLDIPVHQNMSNTDLKLILSTIMDQSKIE